jgi:PfaB family protein
MSKIAIIGVSCLFPGANTPEQYWQNLIENKDLTSLATAEQIGVNANIFYDTEKGKKDKYYCSRGGYIRDFQFDTIGYQISPDLLTNLDSIYKWSLYVAKEALQDSKYLDNKHVLEKCGVILGNLSFPTRFSHHLFAPIYEKVLDSALGELLQAEFRLPSLKSPGDIFPLNAMISGYPATLIAQALGLSGINFCLDAACASSLYAIKLACDRLLSCKADLMLAGAVSSADPLFINMGFSIFQAYPENGVTRPLDKSSGGLVAGEGAGMVVLKRYDDAIRDGDRIYATISGIGLSNDGKGKFVLSPNSRGQVLAFERAYVNAGVNPSDINYIECHATGTPLGDMTELNSIESFFSKYSAAPLIGSAKSNFGHLLTTAGMAGLIKVILSMNKGIIPATINVTEPLSSQIVTSNTSWFDTDIKHAGINAFGFGGTNAHLILESSQQSNIQKNNNINYIPESLQKSKIKNQKLAIIGMDAHFGSCGSLDAFDRICYEGKQNFIPLPPKRWQGIEEIPELLKQYGLDEPPQGGYIKDFEMDFLRFKIPPRDEDQLIPQQLLMLKVADNAIRDAGIKEGGNVAVIVAMGTELTLHQFRGRCDLSWQIKAGLNQANITLSPEQIAELENITKDSLHEPAQLNQYTSFIGNVMASRISALWNFSGSSFTISAEENSVFKALEIAQLLLAHGEVDGVVVGAVDLAGSFENVLLRNQISPINQGVNTLSFDENTNGWMIGEGAGAVVLKLHKTALEENQRIYSVIDAISCTQDNSWENFSKTKSAETIEKTCLLAFKEAVIPPKDIGYLEVFGSGILLEDRAEIKGLNLAYKTNENHLSCAIGSVKANIGNTYAASGIASLIKTALCLYHRYIPATPQWTSPKMPEIWQGSPFYVATESKTWFLEPGQAKRVAAINGLGLDGACSHLILSEELSQQQRPSKYLEQTPFYLFPLAANNQASLLEQIDSLKNAIANSENLSKTAQQAFKTLQKYSQPPYTLAIIGHNQTELLKEIDFAIAGVKNAFEKQGEWYSPLGSYFTANPLGKKGQVAFVYPGMGSSDIAIGKDIFRLFSEIYEKFSTLTKEVGEVLQEKLLYPRSLTKLSASELVEKQAEFLNNGVAMCQSGISLAILYTLIIKDYFQVQPDIAFGYSLGEASSMLFALGVWCDDGTLSHKLVESPIFKNELCGECLGIDKFFKSQLNQELDKKENWLSFLLKAPLVSVRQAIKQEKCVYITFINTAKEVIIAGEPNACLRVIATLNCNYLPIKFKNALHCEVAKSEYQGLIKLHTIPIHTNPNIQFYSAIDGVPISLNTDSIAKNSARLVCQTVDFPKICDRVYEDGARIFIELGSKNNCSRWISKNLLDKEHVAMSINTKGANDYTNIIKVLAKLISHRVSLDLSPLYFSDTDNSSIVKSIIKRITLGGSSIRSQILTPENKQLFQNQSLSKPMKQDIHPHNQEIKIIQLQLANAQIIPPQGRESDIKLPPVQKEIQKASTISSSQVINTHIIWNEADLLEFAEGNISNVFGQEYKIIDTYSRRVRLPMPPYLLVSRVTKLQATKGSFKPCTMTTEYDIPNNAWYSVDKQIPWAIAVESGQCDLLLISYLGIDFENKGHLVYRLLDCTLTFLDDLPKEGETLRYDIKINSFVRNGDNLLFFFSYECFVGNKMVLKMDGGCAGFFSDEQLQQGKGVIYSEKELAEKNKIKKHYFEPLLICQKTSFDKSDLLSLTKGNITTCFGEHYWQDNLNPSLRLPPKDILMLDNVTSIEPAGGAWGLGLIIAEKNLEPQDWYFPCHFKNDQVMAGSLMAEGCGQLLQLYLLYLGLQISTTDARFQAIPGLRQVVRCRGQVTPMSGKLIYRMEITEIGLTPKPYAKSNVEIILNGKIIVHFQDLGLQLSEKKPTNVNPIHTQTNLPKFSQQSLQKPALLNESQVQEFCTGSVSKCFGAEYEIYDEGDVKTSRMPNTHLNFVNRVLSVQGTRHQLTKGSSIITEYDVPLKPWYYRQNSSPNVPYSVLMEIALQPCGFLSAYLGTTLLYPHESLFFRNLDGKGHLVKNIDIRGKTITNTSQLISSSNVQGSIIQSFDFQMVCDGEVFYQGDATFGHFSQKALSNQIGLDKGKDIRPWYEKENIKQLPEIKIDLKTVDSRAKYYQIKPHQPNYRLANHQLDLLHEVMIIESGGKSDQGYIYATKNVNPNDWFFKCHFYLDPVMPGSLGVESIIQAMQVYALELGLGKYLKSPQFTSLTDHTTVWKYRGQIPHGQTEMYLEIHITKIEVTEEKVIIVGDASLWKPGLRIYEIKDVAICLQES